MPIALSLTQKIIVLERRSARAFAQSPIQPSIQQILFIRRHRVPACPLHVCTYLVYSAITEYLLVLKIKPPPCGRPSPIHKQRNLKTNLNSPQMNTKFSFIYRIQRKLRFENHLITYRPKLRLRKTNNHYNK